MVWGKTAKTYKKNQQQWTKPRANVANEKSYKKNQQISRADIANETWGTEPWVTTPSMGETPTTNEGQRPYTWADDPGSKVPEKTQEQIRKEEMLENLEDWPWKGAPKKLITVAPYSFNSRPGSRLLLPEAEQKSPLLRLLEHDLIREKIMFLVLQNHFDAANFSSTCRLSFNLVSYQVGIWDFTTSYFNNCELPRKGPGSTEERHRMGYVQSVTLVSPVRGHEPEITCEDGKNDYLYSKQIASLRTMCLAMYNFADYFKNLQLHRIPFLTPDLLALLIPNMRNLEVLGVYKCPLIHIGHTMRLLDIIKTDKPLEKENQVYLDFFPNYHVGPKYYPGYAYHTGSYGVVWDNWNADTRLAIWALVSRILPKALDQGIDLTGPNTAFRKWLEKSPCWRIDETLKDLMDPTIRPVKLAVSVDFPHYHGREDYFTSKIPNRPESWEWAVQHYVCSSCNVNLLGIFYSFTQIRAARNAGVLYQEHPPIKCLGCTLSDDLDAETDHYKNIKRDIIRRWLEDEEGPNITDLARALEDFEEKNVASDIEALDERRFKHMHRLAPELCYDREYDERQNELTRAELGRLGLKNIAPQVGQYEQWLEEQKKDDEDKQWTWFRSDRVFGHGHAHW